MHASVSWNWRGRSVRYAAMHALALSLLVLSAAPRFVEDDYSKALTQAKQAKKLLFVDAWAPWCHTCVFMREHVLNRPAFGAYEKDIVFAGVDTEKTASAPFLEKFPVDVWPTLFFIDPSTEKLVFKWVGSVDETQMKALLEAARGGVGLVSEADALMASGHAEEAAQKYLTAPKEGSAEAQSRALLSMLSALYLAKSYEACAKTTADQTVLTSAQDRVTALGWGLQCALALKPEVRGARLEQLVKASRAQLADASIATVLADDVSGLYESLVDERNQAQDAAGAQALARDWYAFLEKEAAKAKSPAARAVFDPHRVNAAIAAKVPEKMVEPLKLSEKQLPTDYNPPARLALIDRELGKFDEGLAAIDRALVKCKSGPRKLRLFDTKASLLEKKGDTAGRQKVLTEALAYAKALPSAQFSSERLAALEKRYAQAPAAKQ